MNSGAVISDGPRDVRALTVMIAIQAHISFRSVPRVLGFFLSGGDWIPHFTSVINWTLRFGLALLSQITVTPEPWVAIMDHSIDIGVKKVLVVLRVPLNALLKRGSAVTLEDCECIGIHVSEKSTGVETGKYKQFLSEAIKNFYKTDTQFNYLFSVTEGVSIEGYNKIMDVVEAAHHNILAIVKENPGKIPLITGGFMDTMTFKNVFSKIEENEK